MYIILILWVSTLVFGNINVFGFKHRNCILYRNARRFGDLQWNSENGLNFNISKRCAADNTSLGNITEAGDKLIIHDKVASSSLAGSVNSIHPAIDGNGGSQVSAGSAISVGNTNVEGDSLRARHTIGREKATGEGECYTASSDLFPSKVTPCRRDFHLSSHSDVCTRLLGMSNKRSIDNMDMENLLYKCGILSRLTSGVYTILPVGNRIVNRIKNIMNVEMAKLNAQEVVLPILQPNSLIGSSLGTFNHELFKLKDHNEQDFFLSPTCEDLVTFVMEQEVTPISKSTLPIIIYQINTKFRDELRPSSTNFRSKEFIMKDAYSFHSCQDDSNHIYHKFIEAYKHIFKVLNLKVHIRENDRDVEFIAQTPSYKANALPSPAATLSPPGDILDIEGELSANPLYGSSSTILRDTELGEANKRVTTDRCDEMKSSGSTNPVEGSDGDPFSQDALAIENTFGVEVGHIFKYGPIGVRCEGRGRELSEVFMNSYGIGVSRLLWLLALSNVDEDGVRFPQVVAPYDISIVACDEESLLLGARALEFFESYGFTVIFDDRDIAVSQRIRDMKQIGVPHLMIFSKIFRDRSKDFIDPESERTIQEDSRISNSYNRHLVSLHIDSQEEGNIHKSKNSEELLSTKIEYQPRNLNKKFIISIRNVFNLLNP